MRDAQSRGAGDGGRRAPPAELRAVRRGELVSGLSAIAAARLLASLTWCRGRAGTTSSAFSVKCKRVLRHVTCGGGGRRCATVPEAHRKLAALRGKRSA
jgi:hypothetical protein